LTGNNKLAGSIATVLESLAGSCYRLEYLGLGGNTWLEGCIPAAIDRLRRLTFLTLCGSSGIVGSIQAEIGQPEQLELLYLHKTQISGSIPAAIWSCMALKQRRLDETAVCGTIPAEIGQLEQLERLLVENSDQRVNPCHNRQVHGAHRATVV
jgi:hypothetical protein